MRKLFFPFYKKERHSFLFKHWWFRLGIVLYIISIFIIFGLAFNDHMDSFISCYDLAGNMYYKYQSMTELQYDIAMDECRDNVIQNLPIACIYGVFMIILFHYFIQLVLFVIVIDFIYLGSKK